MASTQQHHTWAHGAFHLPAVRAEAYNAELRDDDGFLGDWASRRAFHVILADWRDRLRRTGDDPLGDKPAAEIGRRRLAKALDEGDLESAGRITIASLLPVALGMAGETYVVIARIFRSSTAGSIAGAVGLTFLLGCWFGWPYGARWHARASGEAGHAGGAA